MRHDELVARLGAWFDKAQRALPWRETSDPYAIWVSEVMLQQTRVATVLSYYPRFLERFPTVRALAEAEVDEVLGAWSGLGYYRRARFLHLGAREIVTRYGGEMPEEAKELRRVPGIGAYTAGAISSIAFGKREALVDGNVARVLARVFALELDIRSTEGDRALWRLASDLVPEDAPGKHNEALMELGATICLPRAPRCLICPLRDLCKAKEEGRQEELPVVAKKKAPIVVQMAALLCRRGDRILLGKRPDEGLFAGMWEPPMIELDEGEEPTEALSKALGRALEGAEEIEPLRHILTHRELRLRVISAKLRGGRLPAPGGGYLQWAWVGEEELSERGVSSLAKKVMGK